MMPPSPIPFGAFRKCYAPPYQIARQHSLLFTEEALRNGLTCPRPSRKTGLGFEYFDPRSSSYHTTNPKFAVYWVQFRKEERHRGDLDLRTGGLWGPGIRSGLFSSEGPGLPPLLGKARPFEDKKSCFLPWPLTQSLDQSFLPVPGTPERQAARWCIRGVC